MTLGKRQKEDIEFYASKVDALYDVEIFEGRKHASREFGYGTSIIMRCFDRETNERQFSLCLTVIPFDGNPAAKVEEARAYLAACIARMKAERG